MILLTGTMKNKERHPAGFSIIELLCVIIILAVVAGLIIPNFKNTFKGIQLRETARDLSSLMRYAQDKAITNGINTRVRFKEDYSSYWLEQQKDTFQGEEKEYERFAGRLGRVFLVAPALSIEANQPFVEFLSDGSVEPQRIYICKNENCYTVSTQEQKNMIRTFQQRIE